MQYDIVTPRLHSLHLQYNSIGNEVCMNLLVFSAIRELVSLALYNLAAQEPIVMAEQGISRIILRRIKGRKMNGVSERWIVNAIPSGFEFIKHDQSS